jgi:hypothetical protein
LALAHLNIDINSAFLSEHPSPHHLNALPSDIEPNLAAWYAAIMQSICSIQYNLIFDAPRASDSERLPVTHLTSAAISG